MRPNHLLAEAAMSLNLQFMRSLFRCISLILGILINLNASGAQLNEKECISLSVKHQSYTDAKILITGLSEVINWENNLKKYKKRLVINPILDKAVFREGICFWEISLYEEAVDHLVLWNTYQGSVERNLIYKNSIAIPGDLTRVK